MTKTNEYIIVCCPQCQIIIERVTIETMVYCITCRKWCREIEAHKPTATVPAPPPKPRRRYRCY